MRAGHSENFFIMQCILCCMLYQLPTVFKDKHVTQLHCCHPAIYIICQVYADNTCK